MWVVVVVAVAAVVAVAVVAHWVAFNVVGVVVVVDFGGLHLL